MKIAYLFPSFALLAFLPLATACSSPSSSPCTVSCTTNEVTIGPVSTQAVGGAPAQAFSVSLSGDACDSADLTCSTATGTQVCTLTPHAAGTCDVQIVLASFELITKAIHVSYSSGPCCAGYHPDDGVIDTSPVVPDASAD